MNDRLKLPIIKNKIFKPSLRSMDEIDAWIEHDYRFLFNREIYEKEKSRCSVNARFQLRK